MKFVLKSNLNVIYIFSVPQKLMDTVTQDIALQ